MIFKNKKGGASGGEGDSNSLYKELRKRSLKFFTLVIAAAFNLFGAQAYLWAQMNFQTFTVLGYETKFRAEDFQTESSGLGLKSALKFSGDVLPNFYVHSEIILSETEALKNLYSRMDNIGWNDGWRRLGADLFSNPLYYFSTDTPDGNPKIRPGDLHAVFKTPWLETELGYREAKLPKHENANWVTVDDSWDAGYSGLGGFVVFKPGDRLRDFEPLRLSAQVSPNRSADRKGTQYGFYSFLAAEYLGHTLDFQYNGAYGYEYDKIFDEIYEADFILGYSGKIGPAGIKANILHNLWGAKKRRFENPDSTIVEIREYYSPASSDVSLARPDAGAVDNTAFALRGEYKADIFEAALGYRFRGAQANMMYVKEDGGDTHLSDQLGQRNTQRAYLYGALRPFEELRINAEAGTDFLLSAGGTWLPYEDTRNVEIYLKPGVEYDMSGLWQQKSKLSVSLELFVCTAEADRYIRGKTLNSFLLSRAELKWELGPVNNIFRGLELLYGFDNQSEKFLYNSLLGTVNFPWDFSLQLGGVIRTANKGIDPDNPDDLAVQPKKYTDYSPGGFFLGALKKIRPLGAPSLYAQFLWNMDPYKSFNDGQIYYDLDGSLLSDGAAEHYNGYSAVRVGMHWKF